MAKFSLAGFKDPVRRPRYIIWTGVVVLVFAAVMVVTLGVTSTRWFCSEACHKVQDDTIIAYNRSSHAEVSCMACHMPPNALPVTFMLHKVEALLELYMTVTDKYELPLNGESEVSLTMGSRQCTQCHNLKNRPITPSAGIKMDHEVHAEFNAACSTCHNRVAHKEDFDLTLTDPGTKEPNKKHADFMKMTACFRCHSLEKGAAAPGACSACHTADFELKPPSHKEKEFFPKGHAELAKEMKAEVDAFKAKEAEGGEAEGEAKAEGESGGEVDVAEAIEAQREAGADPKANIGEELPKVESIFYCSTCHAETFCSNCHGMEMPHAAEFKEPKDAKDPKGHPAISKQKAAKCVMCHGKNDKTHFCDSCHHGKSIGFEYNKSVAWQKQHPKAVSASGVNSCTEKCHSVKFCVDCHTGKRVVPSSHTKANWTKPRNPGALTVYGQTPAKPTAGHSTAALASMESCAVCHGTGGANSKFCKGCHKLEMPHPAQFKENHISGKKIISQCENCHLWRETCSNCHHIGASLSRPWTSVHGSAVVKNGAESCLKCHGGDSGTDKSFCVKCHTKRNVKPASHDAGKFVRDFSATKAVHVQLYTKSNEVCTYCHAGQAAALPNAKFCRSCHKVTIPHPAGFGPGEGEKPTKDNGGQHAALFKQDKLSKRVCENCHKATFCNSCHHTGAPATKPWVRYHPNVVKKNGATPCFDCHQETFCSSCHVNLAKRGLID